MPSSQQQPQPQPQMAARSSTRWCPTPEQLLILEDMYRGSLRMPNASQIQQITAHLARYGRIESKNVFYWFQNHKARERQKLRRRLRMRDHLNSWAVQYYAAAAHQGHGHHHAGFLAAPSTVAPYGHQFLSPSTSPTPAAAAAAAAAASSAAYGYFYPTTTAAFAAPLAIRCAGNAIIATPPSPTTQLFHYQHQGDGGSGGLVPAEALGRPEYSSLGKLDNFGVALDEDVVVSSAASAAVDLTPLGFEVAPPALAAFCRPLKTLDLFPGGLTEEEQHDVA